MPSHVVHAAFWDDTIAWLLVYHVRVACLNRPPPAVLVQLPANKEFVTLGKELMKNPSLHVFYDDTRTRDLPKRALRLYWGTQVTDIYISSEQDAACFAGKYRGVGDTL